MNELILDTPVFLHFLNRELRETEGVNYSDQEIFKYIAVASLMTNTYIYIGDALVWECLEPFPMAVSFLKELEKYNVARFIGTDGNIESFLAKRRRLYSHDRKRYPIYFNDKIADQLWGSNRIIIDDDTTAILARKLFDIANGFGENQGNYSYSSKDKEIIAARLEYRRKKNIAVTYSLFKKEHLSPESISHLKRNIIVNYNQRYMDAIGGKIMTGIPGLRVYDIIQDSGLYYDYNFHLYMFEKMGVINSRAITSTYTRQEMQQTLIEFRCSNDSLFYHILRELKLVACGFQAMRRYMHTGPAFLNSILSQIDIDARSSALDKYCQLQRFSANLCRKNIYFKEVYDKMNKIDRRILVLAASPLEYKVLRNVVKKEGILFEDRDLQGNEDYSYAECYCSLMSKLYLARTDMGSLNSVTAISQLANELNTNYIIMGGICAGLRRDKQHIGEVLIASKIHDYDLSKKTDERRIARGSTISPNKYLYDKFILESYESDLTIDDGLIISSNALANSKEYVEQILLEYPDAKGYEMEGSGLMYAGQLFMDKWILVKAICDWGYDKTDSDQEQAATNSYSFIINTIKRRIG